MYQLNGTSHRVLLAHGSSRNWRCFAIAELSQIATAAWYEQLQRANGGHVQDWARLFLVAGMTHCGGGPATDRFDMLG